MRLTRALLVLVALAALSAAGASSVRAADPADPELGATIESHIYADEDRQLDVWNQSTVPAIFSFTAQGGSGWGVDTNEIILAPDDHASVTVTETGVDGATLDVRIGAVAAAAPGEQRGEILLTALLYTERPPDYALVIGVGVLVLLGVLVVTGRRALRRGLVKES